MALTEIEYGSLASSDIMNSNFEYLDNKITDVSENLASTAAAINSNISTINSSMSSLNESLNESVENLNTTLSESFEQSLSENALYITTYINGSSWYREYFSDSDKTTRVWLEQGGRVSTSSDTNTTITFLKSFSNTSYTIHKNMGYSSTGGVAARWMGFWNLSTTGATTGSLGGSYYQCWYACGI